MMDTGAEYTYVDSDSIKPFYGNTTQDSFANSMLYELKKYQATRDNHNQMEGYNHTGGHVNPPSRYENTEPDSFGNLARLYELKKFQPTRDNSYQTERFNQAGGYTPMGGYEQYPDEGYVNSISPQHDNMYSNTIPGNNETFIPVEDNYMEPSPSPGANSQPTYGNYIESSSTTGPYFAYGHQGQETKPEDKVLCTRCVVISCVIVVLFLIGAAAVAYFISRAFLGDSDEPGMITIFYLLTVSLV